MKKAQNESYVLFQKRSKDKKINPDVFDVTAAGHILTGKGPKDGIREIEEELGLSPNFDELTPLGIHCNLFASGPITNREFCHTFFLEKNIPLTDYKLQKEEVSALVKMKIEDGLSFFAGESDTVRVSGFRLDEDGLRIPVDAEVTRNDFVSNIDPYHLRVFIMADRYFEGKGPLAI